ncbi:MAG: HAD-IA family hydrolase [Candidatus Eisenbacteria bacterium]|uniref:HAD-IA family hydrolase n=1 Tax=Eiseniibacteriota bacterium TaxID=2212470 RepID=A0A948W4W0_UNCEI|nr:HAD-IA family hydrolase [Candidatus Eisenbacteria bacterium]MBU1948624.1 HAD-IA family hydrolase [Candidatus Eisenbacteria bacterium]MBU2689380.1 HAD-IA family hydrolase [Candidatus Eisenbacteria bacterium]
MIRAVLFDLDNTLTDFMKMKEESILAGVQGMIDMGLEMAPKEARRRIYDIYDLKGIEYQKVFDQFLKETYGSVPPELLAAGIVNYRRARDSYLILYPHVDLTLMSLLRRNIRLAVISDAPSLQAWQRLHHLKLHHVFETVVTFETTGEYKPSPQPFQKALDHFGLEPPEVLMVGDWPERDMVGAARLGIRTIFARYGDTKGVVHSGADYEIDDIIQLLDIIDKINASVT